MKKYTNLDLVNETNPSITPKKQTVHQNPNTHKIPTLHETARKFARLEKGQLDEKQYIAYKTIACSYLMGLVHDGNDPNTTLCIPVEINNVVRRLVARGGQNQLIMFLTGPAGSWKSTAVKVTQQFCNDFCLAVGVMWGNQTFLFTTYTGAAASLFGGVTISNAAFLNQQKAMSLNNKNTWQDVRILIVDKVSFMSDKILQTLDVKLKEIKSRAKPFGGFTIIISAGDSHQLFNSIFVLFYIHKNSLLKKSRRRRIHEQPCSSAQSSAANWTHLSMCNNLTGVRFHEPTTAPRDGLHWQHICMSAHPTGNRFHVPTATPQDGLPWQHKCMSVHPTGNRFDAPTASSSQTQLGSSSTSSRPPPPSVLAHRAELHTICGTPAPAGTPRRAVYRRGSSPRSQEEG